LLNLNESFIEILINNNSTYIYFLTKKEVNNLLSKYEHQNDFDYGEIGLFLYYENDCWTAIDNSSEALLMEDFDVFEDALNYLLGESLLNLTKNHKLDINSLDEYPLHNSRSE